MRVEDGGPFGLIPKGHECYLPLDADNLLPLPLRCRWVVSERKTILIDTGIGAKMTAEIEATFRIERDSDSFMASPCSLSVCPEDIVISIYLHADHCGGIPCGSAARLWHRSRGHLPGAENGMGEGLLTRSRSARPVR